MNVYVVSTIQNCLYGDNFFQEAVFAKYSDAATFALNLDLKYNTEAHPKKDNLAFQMEYHALMCNLIAAPDFDEKTFALLSVDFMRVFDVFTRDPLDISCAEFPIFRSSVSKMVVGVEQSPPNLNRIAFYYN